MQSEALSRLSRPEQKGSSRLVCFQLPHAPAIAICKRETLHAAPRVEAGIQTKAIFKQGSGLFSSNLHLSGLAETLPVEGILRSCLAVLKPLTLQN